MKEKWSNDWAIFLGYVGEVIRSGATTEDMSEQFSGKTVQWSGLVDSKDLDELAPGVTVDMPQVQVDLGEGRVVPMKGLHLPVAFENVKEWQSVESGDQILFEAKLGAGSAPFPPIQVTTLRSGRTILRVRLTDAILIHHQRSR